jgi:hypothetical protein
MASYTHERNWGCRIMEVVFRGLRMVILENELLRVSVLADKGSDIYEFLYKPKDVDFMWRSPIPLRNPALFTPTVANATGAFHDNYPGGWQEILPTGGVPTQYKGAEFGYHGEVSLVPWETWIAEDTPDRVTLGLRVRTYRTPFLVEKWLSLERGRPVLQIEERLVNEGEEMMELMWGHHPALGQAFLDDTCRIDLASAKVITQRLGETSRLAAGEGYDWPVVPGAAGEEINLSCVPSRDVRSHDLALLYDIREPWFAIRSHKKGVGFGMRWSPQVFRYLWYWQVFGGAYGYNLYGRSYHLALEPWSSIPGNFELARERGTLLKLQPGEEIRASLQALAFEGSGPVSGIGPEGQVTRG